MADLEIKFQNRAVYKRVGDFLIDEVKYALAGTLNEIGFDSKKVAQERIIDEFIIRKRTFPKLIRVDRATKQNLKVRVYHDSGSLIKQEESKLFLGNLRAVPDKVRSNFAEKIPKHKRPKSLMRKYGYFAVYFDKKSKRKSSSGGARGIGGPGIYFRPKGQREAKRMYLFIKKAYYPKRLRYRDVLRRHFLKNVEPAFIRKLNRVRIKSRIR